MMNRRPTEQRCGELGQGCDGCLGPRGGEGHEQGRRWRQDSGGAGVQERGAEECELRQHHRCRHREQGCREVDKRAQALLLSLSLSQCVYVYV